MDCSWPEDRSVRILVIENGRKRGIDRLIAGIEGWDAMEYAYCQQANKSAALNHALEITGDAFILFLDDDVRVGRQLLLQYSRAAHDLRRGVFLGGRVLVDYVKNPPGWLLPYLPPSAKGWQQTGAHIDSKGPSFLGFNWAAFRSDLVAAGGFDPRVGPGSSFGGTGQERRMQENLIKAGCLPQYLPDALVWHYVPEERCSARWALRRAFRDGVSIGMERCAGNARPQLFGAPAFLVRRAMRQACRFVATLPRSEPDSRFRAIHALVTTLGCIRGATIENLGAEIKGTLSRVGPRTSSAISEFGSSDTDPVLPLPGERDSQV